MDADNSNLETCLRAPTVASLTFGIRVLLYRAQLRHAPRVMVSPPVGYLADVRVILRCFLRLAHVTSKIYMIPRGWRAFVKPLEFSLAEWRQPHTVCPVGDCETWTMRIIFGYASTGPSVPNFCRLWITVITAQSGDKFLRPSEVRYSWWKMPTPCAKF